MKNRITSRNIFLTVVCMLLLFTSKAFAQTKEYALRSLEGNTVKIKITEDYINDEFKVIYGDQCFCFTETYGIEGNVEVEQGVFLKICYKVKMGVGIGMWRTALLCIKGNRLYESLLLDTKYEENMTQVFDKYADSMKSFDEHNHFDVSFKFSVKPLGSLDLKIHDENISKINLKENYIKDSEITLMFDPQNAIFHTGKKKMDDRYTIIKKGTEQGPQLFRGIYPCILINKVESYYMNNVWMLLGNNNTIFENSSECNNQSEK